MSWHRWPRSLAVLALAATMLIASTAVVSAQAAPGLAFAGGEGAGAGRHVVLIAGDEEYRSEEALPQLAQILSAHHGFRATVLFSIDPETGYVDPNQTGNIPGLEALADADLMILAIRGRQLPDEQMQHIDAYLRSGRPVLGLRTSTHAFGLFGIGGLDNAYEHYHWNYDGERAEWTDGFGRLVLGETWIRHHGAHKDESTRGVVVAPDHAIARGLSAVDIWGATDVYGVRLPLPGDSEPIVLGQVVRRAGERDDTDLLYGMRPTDREPVAEKNAPMMPIAWTRSYELPGGRRGKVFATTMGASTDLLSEGVRRMIVNAALWLVGLDVPAGGADAALVGAYQPTAYGFQFDWLGSWTFGVLQLSSPWPERELLPEDFRH